MARGRDQLDGTCHHRHIAILRGRGFGGACCQQWRCLFWQGERQIEQLHSGSDLSGQCETHFGRIRQGLKIEDSCSVGRCPEPQAQRAALTFKLSIVDMIGRGENEIDLRRLTR